MEFLGSFLRRHLRWEASGSAAKCRLFSQANYIVTALSLYAGEEGKGGQQ